MPATPIATSVVPCRQGRPNESLTITATVRRIFEHLVDERGDDIEQATDCLAGMTDRFAITYAEELE